MLSGCDTTTPCAPDDAWRSAAYRRVMASHARQARGEGGGVLYAPALFGRRRQQPVARFAIAERGLLNSGREIWTEQQ